MNIEKTSVNWYAHGARYYDPQLARWHSSDPLAELYTSSSPYNYVANNPVNYIDPNGMSYGPSPDERDKINEGGHYGGWSWNPTRPDYWTAVPSFDDMYVWMQGTEGGAYVRRTDISNYYGADARAYYLTTLGQFDRYNVEYYGTDKYGSTDVLIEDLVGGTAKVHKMAYWQVTGSYSNELYVLDGYLAYGQYNEAKSLASSSWDINLSGIGATAVSGALTAEGAYDNFFHNHSTYRTTTGRLKNIFKSNGQVRSARAQKFATRSKVVKWTGVAGTAWMTGKATYNIVSDVSNNQSISGWDIADGSVGIVGLTGAGLSSVGILSNPIGWGIGAGVAGYSWFSFWYDIGATYGPIRR